MARCRRQVRPWIELERRGARHRASKVHPTPTCTFPPAPPDPIPHLHPAHHLYPSHLSPTHLLGCCAELMRHRLVLPDERLKVLVCRAQLGTCVVQIAASGAQAVQRRRQLHTCSGGVRRQRNKALIRMCECMLKRIKCAVQRTAMCSGGVRHHRTQMQSRCVDGLMQGTAMCSNGVRHHSDTVTCKRSRFLCAIPPSPPPGHRTWSLSEADSCCLSWTWLSACARRPSAMFSALAVSAS